MPKTRKNIQSEKSRAAILAATMDLISKHGFSGTTVDKIAYEAGLSKGSIFWHFNNKEKLFIAVIETIRNGLLQGLSVGQANTLTCKERLNLLLDNYAALIEADCSRCLDLTVLIIEMVETNPELAGRLRDLFSELAELLTALLDEAKERGEVRGDIDTRMTAYAIVGNLQGMTVQYYLNRDRLEYQPIMKAYKKLMLDGLFLCEKRQRMRPTIL
ncbi:MAG: TetR/AcrR family transcriptional regulator [Candidatus Abyssobacteria bacterium SURF_17]|uniref:TetR/AcrR family transcriptional regulator n=1 Tax=Candidatus Abyssobacteria bacterium SURF_17 TaxID=2093361 RepID=A0A419EMP7_9BACT|nr:MAG: TetR/AcrR family transcriptional regulator [Candidatus Abyssubacteria bacterium SURF_17]